MLRKQVERAEAADRTTAVKWEAATSHKIRTLEAPEKAPWRPIGKKGRKLLILKCGIPAANTKAIKTRLTTVTAVLNLNPLCVPCASSMHRKMMMVRAGKSRRKYLEPIGMRRRSASPWIRAPVYEVKERATAAALSVYSRSRLEAPILSSSDWQWLLQRCAEGQVAARGTQGMACHGCASQEVLPCFQLKVAR
jgi:hypothetical protein